MWEGAQLGAEVLVEVEVGVLAQRVAVDDRQHRHARRPQRRARPGASAYESSTTASSPSTPTAGQRPGSAGAGHSGNARCRNCDSAHADPATSPRNSTSAPRPHNSSASATQRTRWPTPLAAPASQRNPHPVRHASCNAFCATCALSSRTSGRARSQPTSVRTGTAPSPSSATTREMSRQSSSVSSVTRRSAADGA